jgi:general secretion pathway protein D
MINDSDDIETLKSMTNINHHFPRRAIAFIAALCSVALLSSCATDAVIPPKLDVPARANAPIAGAAATPGDASSEGRTTSIATNPSPPLAPAKATPAPVVPSGGSNVADITLNFDQLPLPAFIQAVYATALKKNISIDPAVTARKDLVTLRSGKQMTAAEAESSARLLLKTYGIAVQDLGGLIRIVPDTSNVGYLPEIRRGRALPETPLPLRPVFQLIELQAVRQTEITSYLRTLFADKIRVTEDPVRNALLIAGNGDDVQAALDAIQVLDQPLMKGRNSIRITPNIWSAEELTKRLTEILLQEGYAVGSATSGSIQFPITLLPISGINSVIVFAQSKEVIEHITQWAKVLDKPAEKSVGRAFFSYQVRNTDASRLAETIQKLLSGTPTRATPATTGTTGAAAAPSAASTGVVVDKATNTILFRATGEEYTDIIRLLNDLDRTARQVLIEVTIAEVVLSEGMTTGIDWIFRKNNSSGRNVVGLGGIGNPPATPDPDNPTSAFTGFVVSQFDGIGSLAGLRAELRAEANDGRVTFLSNPKTLARNGETASIQVGDSIPILTQQQTNSATGGNGLISTVQYAETGTIMRIKPVIHSSDQVDMDVNVESSLPGVIASKTGPQTPPIQKRTLETKLTLKHGSTYVLGGLISNRISNSSTGVPFLKDIPILGYAFKSNTQSTSRTELIIMITPYIMNDDGEARAVTDAVRKQLGAWAQDEKPLAAPKP